MERLHFFIENNCADFTPALSSTITAAPSNSVRRLIAALRELNYGKSNPLHNLLHFRPATAFARFLTDGAAVAAVTAAAGVFGFGRKI